MVAPVERHIGKSLDGKRGLEWKQRPFGVVPLSVQCASVAPVVFAQLQHLVLCAVLCFVQFAVSCRCALYRLCNGFDPVSYTHLDVYKRQA